MAGYAAAARCCWLPHYPFPNAVEGLAAALGLDVAKGMTGDPAHHAPGEDDSYLMFARADGLLGVHPILEGRSPRERISRVATFTGDAFRARDGGVVPLLPLADSARLRRAVPRVTRNGADTSVEVGYDAPVPGAGWVQGAAFAFGAGRVVVLAEAAMLTAQEGGTGPIGMNAPGNDNRQFALNVMRWLGRAY